MKLTKVLYSTAAVALCGAGVANAVTQGTTGSTSSGTVQVSMTISEDVKISALADLPIGAFVPDGTDETDTSPACVYYNNAANYDLTLTSANSAGPGYQMVNGANSIPYTVEWDPAGGNHANHIEAATVKYGSANTASTTCGGTPQAELKVTVTDGGSPLGLPNLTYTDTITLLVAPNP